MNDHSWEPLLKTQHLLIKHYLFNWASLSCDARSLLSLEISVSVTICNVIHEVCLWLRPFSSQLSRCDSMDERSDGDCLSFEMFSKEKKLLNNHPLVGTVTFGLWPHKPKLYTLYISMCCRSFFVFFFYPGLSFQSLGIKWSSKSQEDTHRQNRHFCWQQ